MATSLCKCRTDRQVGEKEVLRAGGAMTNGVWESTREIKVRKEIGRFTRRISAGIKLALKWTMKHCFHCYH